MVRAMLASVVITTLLGMSSIGHAQSGSVDTRDYLIWRKGDKSKSTKGLTGTPGQKTRVNKIDALTLKQTPHAYNPKEISVDRSVRRKRMPKGTIRCAPVGSSRPSAAC